MNPFLACCFFILLVSCQPSPIPFDDNHRALFAAYEQANGDTLYFENNLQDRDTFIVVQLDVRVKWKINLSIKLKSKLMHFTLIKYSLLLLPYFFTSCSSNNSSQEQEEPTVEKTDTSVENSLDSYKYTFTDFSPNYVYAISRQVEKEKQIFHYKNMNVIVREKSSKEITDSVFINSCGYFTVQEETYKDASSYITNVNIVTPIVDNYAGFFVVADFNFDNREDFACLKGLESTSGPYYNFYIQQEDKKFLLDSFLTDSIGFFPATINSATKQLITEANMGAWGKMIITYSFDKKENNWVIVSKEVIDFDNQ